MPKDNRYTIALSPTAEQALKMAMRSTHYKSVPDVVRAAIGVFVDLLDVESRELSIVFRDKSGQEWSYSPHYPGRASLVKKPELGRKNNVIAGVFPPRSTDSAVQLGMNALPQSDTTEQNTGTASAPRHRRKTNHDI